MRLLSTEHRRRGCGQVAQWSQIVSRTAWQANAANEAIRKVLHRVAFEAGTVLVVPPAELCTDNGAMIAWAGAERLALGLTDTLTAAPHARWSLHDVTGPAPPTSAEAPEIDADSVTQSRMADD